MKRAVAVVALLTVWSVGLAIAADHTIGQKGKVFSQEKLTIKKGDSVTFLNDDTITHNIMSTTAGNEFNLGAVKPGNGVPVTFDKAGTIGIICAIHPRMKMTVEVVD